MVPVMSANVHEIRAYNRLAAAARGSVLVLLQDDQLFDSQCSWMKAPLAIFQKYRQVGCRLAGAVQCCALWLASTKPDAQVSPSCLLPRQVAVVGMNSCKLGHAEEIALGHMVLEDKQLGVDMQFCALVDTAPLVVRRSVFLELGGLDEGLSEPGECGEWTAAGVGWGLLVVWTDAVACCLGLPLLSCGSLDYMHAHLRAHASASWELPVRRRGCIGCMWQPCCTWCYVQPCCTPAGIYLQWHVLDASCCATCRRAPLLYPCRHLQ